MILGGDVELRALHHTHEKRRLDAQLAAAALANAVERVAARLHDPVRSAPPPSAPEIPAACPARR